MAKKYPAKCWVKTVISLMRRQTKLPSKTVENFDLPVVLSNNMGIY